MLTERRPTRAPPRRPQQSLRQEYEEFILQRIEEFKEQITRTELLTIADDAVRELEAGAEDQLVLTEVLVLEHVDRLIMRRLNLPTYRRWRDRHLRLRRAQRQPTHWGLEPDAPLVALAGAPDCERVALVAGAGAAPAALFLAAYDWPVLFIDGTLGTVEAMETRAAAEALAGHFQALVVRFGDWFPDVAPALTVLDTMTLDRLPGRRRARFLGTLRDRTPPGGAHCFLPPPEADGAPQAVAALPSEYAGWRLERTRGDGRPPWIVTVKP